MLAAEEFGEQRFALLNWLAAQILAVKLKQIERAEDGTRKCAVAADQIKDGKPVLVANNRFAVDQARMRPSFFAFDRSRRRQGGGEL